MIFAISYISSSQHLYSDIGAWFFITAPLFWYRCIIFFITAPLFWYRCIIFFITAPLFWYRCLILNHSTFILISVLDSSSPHLYSDIGAWYSSSEHLYYDIGAWSLLKWIHRCYIRIKALFLSIPALLIMHPAVLKKLTNLVELSSEWIQILSARGSVSW